MNIEKLILGGHSATYLYSKDLVLGIDPWVTGNPLCPDSHKNLSKLDLIVLTHGHADHAGDAARFAKTIGSHIVAPYELAMILMQHEGVPASNVTPMNKGGTVEVMGLKISLTHALHSSSYDTKNGTLYAGEPCGVVVHGGKHSIYHAGDTLLFSDMSLIKDFYHPTIALFPVGDRFTMGPREAARAAKLVGAKINIPIHHTTFDMLTGTPEEFKKECSALDIGVKILKPGEIMSVA